MNIERRMEFIVENLADIAARQQRAEIRAERTDRQIRGLQKLVKTGMQLLVRQGNGQAKLKQRQDKVDAEMAELRQALKELATAQKRTDARFDRWLDSFKNGANGQHKKKSN